VRLDGELKILFAGPVGAGKTTAVRALSDVPPVSTEVAAADPAAMGKQTTTVAMDFGQILLPEGTSVSLYGSPGQERFSFMWEILAQGALGVVLLIDGSSAGAREELVSYAQAFCHLNAHQPFVVGVGRIAADDPLLDECARALAQAGIVAPVLSVDVRRREDVLLLLDALLSLMEATS
jgi:signal recognition particle receptor subunit beta